MKQVEEEGGLSQNEEQAGQVGPLPLLPTELSNAGTDYNIAVEKEAASLLGNRSVSG